MATVSWALAPIGLTGQSSTSYFSRMGTTISEKLPRCPYDTVGGLVFLPRMFHKIRLHAEGVLPKTYHQNLGRELDGHGLAFLHLAYSDVKDRVLAGGTEEEILE